MLTVNRHEQRFIGEDVSADVGGIACGSGDAQIKLTCTEHIKLVIRRHMTQIEFDAGPAGPIGAQEAWH